METSRRHNKKASVARSSPPISFELPPAEGEKNKYMDYQNKENPHYYKVWYTAYYGPLEYHLHACEKYDAWENQKKFGKVAP